MTPEIDPRVLNILHDEFIRWARPGAWPDRDPRDVVTEVIYWRLCDCFFAAGGVMQFSIFQKMMDLFFSGRTAYELADLTSSGHVQY